MFAQLPKLFDRNFAIGYFLPFAIFLSAAAATLNVLDSSLTVEDYLSEDLLVETTAIGLITWVGGIVLLLTNRGLIRFLEGYGVLSWIWLPGQVQLDRYRGLHRRLKQLDREWIDLEEREEEIPSQLQTERTRIMRALVERYPDRENLLLPTAFGNAIRAFEVYPRVMYGLEGIQGWLRILPLLPDDYRKMIDEAKVGVDFWVNVLALAAVYVLLFFIGAHWVGGTEPINLLLPLAAFVLFCTGYARAVAAAQLWGEYVKAAFDVYHAELASKLGFTLPADADARKRLWIGYSQAAVFRNPSYLLDRANPAQSSDSEPPEAERELAEIQGIRPGIAIEASLFRRLSRETQREILRVLSG